jgi:hypothetical protein
MLAVLFQLAASNSTQHIDLIAFYGGRGLCVHHYTHHIDLD